MRLPKFIEERIKTKNTSLGDNLALPPEEDYVFEYKMVKEFFSTTLQEMSKTFPNIDIRDTNQLVSLLNKLMSQCQELEKPFRKNLEDVCVNAVNEILAIPAETVHLECKLVDTISPKHQLRVMPEDATHRDFDFNDITDMENVKVVIMKRRFINALIQGASHDFMTKLTQEAIDEVYSFNKELLSLYKQIIVLNDFLLLTKEEKITDDKPSQGACVEVELRGNNEKVVIYSQGLIFPYLFQETIRGFMELFASHGLPQDNKKANYILRQSDFLLAEPWDIRLGVMLWKHLVNEQDMSNILPYFFTMLCSLQVEEFNEQIREMLANTKAGKKYFKSLCDEATHDYQMNRLIITIDKKNADQELLDDGYMSSEDLDAFVIEEDDVVLSEAASPLLYHFCSLGSLIKMLKDNKMYLNGNEEEYNDGYQNFASFTRNKNSKQGYPYMQSRYSGGGGTLHNMGSRWMMCRMEFDGNVMNTYNQFRDKKGNKGKFTVEPFDYLYNLNLYDGDESQPLMNGKQEHMAFLNRGEDEELYRQPFSQAEDRLMSNSEYIPNLLKYVNKIDVLVDYNWLMEDIEDMGNDEGYINNVIYELKLLIHTINEAHGLIKLYASQDEFDHQINEVNTRYLAEIIYKLQ